MSQRVHAVMTHNPLVSPKPRWWHPRCAPSNSRVRDREHKNVPDGACCAGCGGSLAMSLN